jgi:hypothetical protein
MDLMASGSYSINIKCGYSIMVYRCRNITQALIGIAQTFTFVACGFLVDVGSDFCQFSAPRQTRLVLHSGLKA